MKETLVEYRCAVCGHTWIWSYLFVLKCPQCKVYSGFKQAAQSERFLEGSSTFESDVWLDSLITGILP